MNDIDCCICGKQTSEFAADPGKWAVTFGHIGGNGRTFTHCGECCAKMHAAYSQSDARVELSATSNDGSGVKNES